ncbi:MAG: hypothetical protein PHQ40_01075 [Anaerolineaceae bacterium]|nr:hypothetical protein [Anaerolineaceae bacterium]
MSKLSELKPLAPYLIACAAACGLLFFYRSWSYDDPYITYRYAFNLLHGNGFVYNPGERILSTTTPLFAILLALLGFIWNDLPSLAVLIGSVCIGASALIFFKLCMNWGFPLAGWAGLFLLPTFSILAATLSSETPLYIMLGLWLIYSYTTENFAVSGVLASLLVLSRPDGILLPVLLAVHFLLEARKPIPWKGVIIFATISLIAWGGIWIYFGSPLPVTLAAKQQQGVMSISQGFAQGLLTLYKPQLKQPYFVVEVALTFLGIVWLLYKKSPAWILLAWTVLYFTSYSMLGVTRYFWYYAPLVPGFVLLISIGVEAINRLGKMLHLPGVGMAIVLILIVSLFLVQGRSVYRQSINVDRRVAIYRAVGEWLRGNTPQGSSVGALEVGIIGYYSQKPMIDFAGLIQPEVSKQMRANRTYFDTAKWAITRYQPEYLVLYQNNQADLVAYSALSGCSEETRFAGPDYQFTDTLMIEKCVYR